MDREPLNPFEDLPAIPIDGRPKALTEDIVPLGPLETGDVLRVRVEGPEIEAVLILLRDEVVPESGVLVGGGPSNTEFQYLVQRPGAYFVFVQFDPQARAQQRVGDITVAFGDAEFRPPARQIVQVLFAEDYLTAPGLFDPVDGGPEELAFLNDISDLVQGEILARLRAIYAGTPIEILGAQDPVPDEPFSRVTFLPDRVLAEDQDEQDAALPPPDPTRPECQVRVTFGEVLPDGTKRDPGNQDPGDEAVVYVGSFQGRGRQCWTAAINSLNNVVLTLSQTAAHEIGHLIGLYHVEQIDIMNRTATLAFQRELALARGQIQIEKPFDGAVQAEVLPTVVQDPAIYLGTVFDTAGQ